MAFSIGGALGGLTSGISGALSNLSGYMGDVAVAVPAAQEFERNQQMIEMNKMKLLMEKQQIQSDADFGKAMEDLSRKSQQPGADNSSETRLKSLYDAALRTKNVKIADKIAGQITQLEEYKQTQERLKQEHEDSVSDRRQRERELEMYRHSILSLKKEQVGLKKEQIEKPASAKSAFQERSSAYTMDVTMREAGISMENLSQLTQQGMVHTTSGAFENISDHGVFGATSKVMGQSITPQSAQMYSSIMLPLARMASTAQSGGRYKINDAAVKQSIESFIAQPGQTHMVMLEKMAELKQTLIQGALGSVEAGTMNPEQEKSVKDNINKIEKSIPWSVSDVIEFYQKGGKAENFGKFLDKKYKSDTDSSGWKDM